MVGTQPAGCQSPSVNNALIGCCPVRTGPPEKSNYWLRGFKAAQGRLMKGDKLRTVSRTPAGRPQQPRSRSAAKSLRIKGIRRERGSGRAAQAGLRPRASLTWGGGSGRWWGLRDWAPASCGGASGAALESPGLAGKRWGSAGPGRGTGQGARARVPAPAMPRPGGRAPRLHGPRLSQDLRLRKLPRQDSRRPREERRHA